MPCRISRTHGVVGVEAADMRRGWQVAYDAYPTAEAVHCSGILALFVCSVLMGHYHVHSLSTRARAAVELTLKSISHLTETFVFIFRRWSNSSKYQSSLTLADFPAGEQLMRGCSSPFFFSDGVQGDTIFQFFFGMQPMFS